MEITKIMKEKEVIKLIEYSYSKKLKHIPSALSQYQYLIKILPFLTKEKLNGNINISIGKPFGSQAYYLIWEENNFLKPGTYEPILNHDEIDFIDFSDTTLGNAIGIASGMTIATSKKTWVNTSDAVFQIGSTIEALQFIGLNKLNILITVDYNSYQLTSKNKFSIEYTKNMLESFNIKTTIIRNNDIKNCTELFIKLYNDSEPNIILFETIKGYGVNEIIKNLDKWHYKIISDDDIGLLRKGYK